MSVNTNMVWAALAAIGVGGSSYAGTEIARRSIHTEAEVRSFVHNGQWYTDKGFGNADATALTRAYVAVVGLLALSREETVYYLAHTDEEGNPLSSDNVYEISGGDLPARWWSITLYDADHFLTENDENKYSVKATDMVREPDGSYRMILSRDPREGNWIPMANGQEMSLLLRMYNPEPHVLDHLADIALPKIRKIEGRP